MKISVIIIRVVTFNMNPMVTKVTLIKLYTWYLIIIASHAIVDVSVL